VFEKTALLEYASLNHHKRQKYLLVQTLR